MAANPQILQDQNTVNERPEQVTVSIRNMPVDIWNKAHANSRSKRMTLKDYIIQLILKDTANEEHTNN